MDAIYGYAVDVVVVGAGPVGLLAAIELTLAGAGVLVLERLPKPSKVLKAGGIGPLGLEALQRRGMVGRSPKRKPPPRPAEDTDTAAISRV